jgi:hypothetical protein
MVHRRELLKSGAGLLLAAPIRIPLRLLTGAAGAKSEAPDVIAETGIAAASELIAAARANARHARAVDLDSTIMIRRLSEAWETNPRPLFGMTRSDVAILVEALARDRGMAVVYRGWHDHRASGDIHHVLYGNPDVIAMMQHEFTSARGGFGKVLGRHVAELASVGPQPASINFTVETSGRPPRQARFVTWAVAPMGTAAA